MATLEALEKELLSKIATTDAPSAAPCQKRPLSDAEYSLGFAALVGDTAHPRSPYQRFIIPHLTHLLAPLVESRARLSVLEIGPGPGTILECLPWHLQCSIRKYTAHEPNTLFATKLKGTFVSAGGDETKQGGPLPCLECEPHIRQMPFVVGDDGGCTDTAACSSCDGTASSENGKERFDVILFCHGMYGMVPKRAFIEKALGMLVERVDASVEGLLVVFHRDQALRLDGLVCHRTATFPAGSVSVMDEDQVLDQFASFVAGFAVRPMHHVRRAMDTDPDADPDADPDPDADIRMEWRKVCRAMGRREEGQQGQDAVLVFSSPEVMVAFTKHATALPELVAQVPLRVGGHVKNRHARRHHAACIVRPTETQQVRQCVLWALRHGTGLTVLGGGHSGHCVWPNVVAVDMGAFNDLHIVESETSETSTSGHVVVAGAGCQTGDIVRKTLAAGLAVPLGPRPSVGAGLWLQGGIGPLTRLHGLACDAVVGAVVVGAGSGLVHCIGRVPSRHRPVDCAPAENEDDLLWALKGAGTNLGIVVSIAFKAHPAPVYSVRNWVVPLSDSLEARRMLGRFDELVASQSSRNCTAGAFLYYEEGTLRLGVTLVESCSTRSPGHETLAHSALSRLFGPRKEHRTVDGVGMFETEMYMSGMHGGHGGGKTSSFKRCLFLKRIADPSVAGTLVGAFETRPSPLCYLHLLQGGGAVRDVAPDASAFGCRDWDFACVVTGVWTRDQDGTEISREAVRWVYNVAEALLPSSWGAYGADLGPDPRDAALAASAFGPNLPRLIRLKHTVDPQNVLAYACPLPTLTTAAVMAQTLIILVTGESGAGKDYCADIWASTFGTCAGKSLRTHVVSISDETKREYAAATGADLDRLLRDRRYKEQHRAALTAFFHAQVRQRPQIREEHFQNVVGENAECDVLLITGMRDEAPLAAFSHLVPKSRLLEVRIEASKKTRRARRGEDNGANGVTESRENNGFHSQVGQAKTTPAAADFSPSFTFTNESMGCEAAKMFAQKHLLRFLDDDLRRLATMVRPVPNFPRPGIVFRHVLDIVQQPTGLDLCTSLLQAHFAGDWAQIDAVACCEFGGSVFASALALRVDASLALIRDASKLPPPTISVTTWPSHISSLAPNGSIGSGERRIGMGRGVVPAGASVVVVDDVLASGTTLCAVLELLGEAGVDAEKVHAMVVAEFPIHRGRETLRRRGFGRVTIQSLVILDGV